MDNVQKIPLRVFYRTIDDLIINHQSDAAISRALYLLQNFPKNYSVYQLLGKALLDKQEFIDAKIVFEKILDINPDDFVSHIGISIIAESSGNLEKALESMWRAYELQPTNESLQNEVKRLQESSTGFIPEKIRMTRGTLIKMYSRSLLADQAIAEARLGIQEKPDRIDYKIHLAKMLDFSGKKIEAIETCLDIIRTFPFCNDALVILFRCLPSTSESSDSSIYKSRLSELDPYFKFMKPETGSVDDIPDIAIMVEERNESEIPIEKIGMFIRTTWDAPVSDIEKTEIINKNEDWSSIINEAVSSNNLGSPINDTTFEVVNSPEKENDIDEENHSVLDEKYRNPQIDINTSEKMVDKPSGSPDAFPEENSPPLKEEVHVQDDSGSVQIEMIEDRENGGGAQEKPDDISNHEPWNLNKEITAKELLIKNLRSNRKNSSLDDNPDWVFKEKDINTTETINSKIEDKPALDNFNSMDFTPDEEIAQNFPFDSELESSSTFSPSQGFHDWEIEQTPHEAAYQNVTPVLLDDTQKIKILSKDPDILFSQAFDSIAENDFHFAKKCFSKLIDSNYQLIKIANRIEDYCQENPDELDLWLILVEIYKKLGLEEKTLSTLVKAQKNLSFK